MTTLSGLRAVVDNYDGEEIRIYTKHLRALLDVAEAASDAVNDADAHIVSTNTAYLKVDVLDTLEAALAPLVEEA